MSFLTYPMLLNRVPNDFDNLLMYIPFNEGSGNSFSDIKGDVVVTDDVTASWTTLANATTTNSTGAITSGTLPTVAAGKKLIAMDMVKINTSSSLQSTRIGRGTNERQIGLSIAASVENTDGVTGNTAAFQTLTAGQTCMRLLTWDTETGVLNAFSKVGSAAAQFDNTATNSGSDYLGEISFTTQEMTIGGNATKGDWFGIAAIDANSLPSNADIIAAMEKAYSDWAKGLNVLPAAFQNI